MQGKHKYITPGFTRKVLAQYSIYNIVTIYPDIFNNIVISYYRKTCGIRSFTMAIKPVKLQTMLMVSAYSSISPDP